MRCWQHQDGCIPRRWKEKKHVECIRRIDFSEKDDHQQSRLITSGLDDIHFNWDSLDTETSKEGRILIEMLVEENV